jgi:hypothetical protein
MVAQSGPDAQLRKFIFCFTVPRAGELPMVGISPFCFLGLIRGFDRGNCHLDRFSGTRKGRRLGPSFEDGLPFRWAVLSLMTSSHITGLQIGKKVIDNYLLCSFAIFSNATTRFYCHR